MRITALVLTTVFLGTVSIRPAPAPSAPEATSPVSDQTTSSDLPAENRQRVHSGDIHPLSNRQASSAQSAANRGFHKSGAADPGRAAAVHHSLLDRSQRPHGIVPSAAPGLGISVPGAYRTGAAEELLRRRLATSAGKRTAEEPNLGTQPHRSAGIPPPNHTLPVQSPYPRGVSPPALGGPAGVKTRTTATLNGAKIQAKP